MEERINNLERRVKVLEEKTNNLELLSKINIAIAMLVAIGQVVIIVRVI